LERVEVTRLEERLSKTQTDNAFGYELLLDLYDCKPGVCDDLALCYKFLD